MHIRAAWREVAETSIMKEGKYKSLKSDNHFALQQTSRRKLSSTTIRATLKRYVICSKSTPTHTFGAGNLNKLFFTCGCPLNHGFFCDGK